MKQVGIELGLASPVTEYRSTTLDIARIEGSRTVSGAFDPDQLLPGTLKVAEIGKVPK